MEFQMRYLISYTALAALMAATSAAHAQAVDPVITTQPGPAVIAQEPLQEPVATAPVETVETVRTVQSTTAPRHRTANHPARLQTTSRVTTTRTTVRRGIVTAPAVVAAEPALVPAPRYYDVVTPGSVAPPLVQSAVPVDAAAFGAPVPIYRYVYEPDRILVIDPNTGIAVQAIPR